MGKWRVSGGELRGATRGCIRAGDDAPKRPVAAGHAAGLGPEGDRQFEVIWYRGFRQPPTDQVLPEAGQDRDAPPARRSAARRMSLRLGAGYGRE